MSLVAGTADKHGILVEAADEGIPGVCKQQSGSARSAKVAKVETKHAPKTKGPTSAQRYVVA